MNLHRRPDSSIQTCNENNNIAKIDQKAYTDGYAFQRSYVIRQ